MTESLKNVSQTLAQLGVKSAEQLWPLFTALRQAFESDAATATDEITWKSFRDAWLGRRSGILAAVTDSWLKPAPPELKKIVGQALNELRAHVEAVIEERHRKLEAATEQSALARERVDLSLPGVTRPVGFRHPIRQTFEEVERIFLSLGYHVVSGPEIETPYYNFEALNIPEFHPTRDNMDTFYMEAPPGAEPRLLRTHTSPMQIRTMEKQKPPVRIIVPGRVYRRDNPDATHSFAFHQVEGLAVDTDLTFCDFAGTIDYFAREFFGPGTKTRFRPSYFPFTEPSVEFDASCIFCGGTGTVGSGANCSTCKGSGWIELFGAGMVDPAVYGFVKYDAAKLNGFAFGIGIDRLAMIKFGINDLQVFFQNDVRFLRQFP
jgi:phenylalanyl-tRNA synthetase alpha chain